MQPMQSHSHGVTRGSLRPHIVNTTRPTTTASGTHVGTRENTFLCLWMLKRCLNQNIRHVYFLHSQAGTSGRYHALRSEVQAVMTTRTHQARSWDIPSRLLMLSHTDITWKATRQARQQGSVGDADHCRARTEASSAMCVTRRRFSNCRTQLRATSKQSVRWVPLSAAQNIPAQCSFTVSRAEQSRAEQSRATAQHQTAWHSRAPARTPQAHHSKANTRRRCKHAADAAHPTCAGARRIAPRPRPGPSAASR
jgi:hypothetical protein